MRLSGRGLALLLAAWSLAGCRTPKPLPGTDGKPFAPRAEPEKALSEREALPAERAGDLFLVIDDAGLSMAQARRFLDIPIPMTLAVMPHRKVSREVAEAVARDPLKEAILHQPMEAYRESADPGAGALFTNTPLGRVAGMLADNLSTVPGARGMNNHMGSLATEDVELMRVVLSFCQTNGLFFLDSRTAYNSRVPEVAEELGVHVEQRDVFLDIRHDRASIQRRWAQAIRTARKNGYAVVIGHAWSAETAAVVRDSVDALQKAGFRFRRLSELYAEVPDAIER